VTELHGVLDHDQAEREDSLAAGQVTSKGKMEGGAPPGRGGSAVQGSPASSPRAVRASPFTQPSSMLLPGAAQPPWFAAAYAGPPPGSPRVTPTPLAGASGAAPAYDPGLDRVPPAAAAAVAGLQQRVSDVLASVVADIRDQQEEFEDVKYELRSLARALGAISGVVSGVGCPLGWGVARGDWPVVERYPLTCWLLMLCQRAPRRVWWCGGGGGQAGAGSLCVGLRSQAEVPTSPPRVAYPLAFAGAMPRIARLDAVATLYPLTILARLWPMVLRAPAMLHPPNAQRPIEHACHPPHTHTHPVTVHPRSKS
jgi:hypothetical protein